MGLYVKPMEGQELLSFLFGGGRKSYVFHKCILRRDFLSPHIGNGLGYRKTIPAPACLVALMIWHSCYCTKTFGVCGPRIYQSENKLLPLVV